MFTANQPIYSDVKYFQLIGSHVFVDVKFLYPAFFTIFVANT